MSSDPNIRFLNSRLYDDVAEKKLMKNLFHAVVERDLARFKKLVEQTDTAMSVLTNRETYKYSGEVSLGRRLDLFGLIGYVGDKNFINHAFEIFPKQNNMHKTASRLLAGAQLNPENADAPAYIYETAELPASYAIANDFATVIKARHYPFLSYLIAKGANPMIGDVRGNRPALIGAANLADEEALDIISKSKHFTASLADLDSVDGFPIDDEIKPLILPHLKRNDGMRVLRKFETAFKSAYEKENSSLKALKDMTLKLKERPGDDEIQYYISGPLYAAVIGDIDHLVKLYRRDKHPISAEDLYAKNENDLCIMDFVQVMGLASCSTKLYGATTRVE